MPTIFGGGPTYAQGDDGTFVGFTSPDAAAAHDGLLVESWIRFDDLALALASALITSATLTIHTFNNPLSTDEAIEAKVITTEDETLPPDWATATALPVAGSVASGSLNGLTTYDFDVTAILESLRAGIDGDVIMFRMLPDAYNGTGFTYLASLSVTYTGGPGTESLHYRRRRTRFFRQGV
jgi:hypothetical protein